MSQKPAKTKKKTHLPTPTIPKPWPNLPRWVLNLLERKPDRMRNITSFGGVTKTWRSPSKKCSGNGKSRLPQLVEINEKDKNIRPHTIDEISFHEEYPYPYYKRRSYEKHWYPGRYFQGHSHGQTIVMADNFSDCFCWEPSRRFDRSLPSWNRNIYFKTCALSKFPGDYPTDHHFSAMVLTGSSSPAFAFYRHGKCVDREWILENCSVEEPYASGENMRFCDCIGFQGKFYALSLQGTVVAIEEVDSRFGITGIGGNRAVPRKVSREFREYLVESEGEILLVFLVSRKSIGFVDDVEVFRLDISRLLWVELESIGDRALFLEDECCMGVIAGEVGCVRNCVYFSHDWSDEWWVFDMENGRIAPAFGSVADVKECRNRDEPVESTRQNDVNQHRGC